MPSAPKVADIGQAEAEAEADDALVGVDAHALAAHGEAPLAALGLHLQLFLPEAFIHTDCRVMAWQGTAWIDRYA